MSTGVTFEGNNGPVTIINENSAPRASIIGRLIEIIAIGNRESLSLDRIPAEIEHKVQFNDLKKFQWLVDEYVESSLLINESVRELNQTILNGSTRLKRQMKLFYVKALNKFDVTIRPFDLEKLRAHSDEIVQEVINLTTRFVKSSSDLKDGFFEEDLENGVTLITSYSIIECVVLENPNDHN